MITINPNAADVITININDADQIQLNTAAIVIASGGDADTLQGEDGAYYLSRANHTGTQAANTITGLAVVATSGSYNDLSNKPTISTNAETLDGQDGAYYLSRGNHTGTQAISTISGLQDALDLKLDAASLSDAGAILPTDQLVIYRNGVPLRTTVAQLGLAPTPPSVDLLLVPTGATESADGEFQRFAYDGVHAYEVAPETFYPLWHAELSAQDRQSEYQIKLKMPELTDDQAVNVFITEADISLAALLERDFNYFALELRANDGSTALLLNIADDQPNSGAVGFSQPAAGSVITLTLTTTSLDYAYDGGTGSMDIPADFFANPPNIWAYSGAMSAADVLPLSIKVLHTE